MFTSAQCQTDGADGSGRHRDQGACAEESWSRAARHLAKYSDKYFACQSAPGRTGFGITVPISRNGALSSGSSTVVLDVRVTVAGGDAKVMYAGGAPGLVAGVSQINFEVPTGVTAGDAAVVVTAGGFASTRSTIIAIK